MEKKRSPLQFKFLSAGRRVGHFAGTGSSVVLFMLIVLTPVCQFHPLAASLCCSFVLLALAGVQDLVILAGEFSELNSFHLGQDCPQSFLNLTGGMCTRLSADI